MKKFCLIPLCATLLAGCVSVPTSTIKIGSTALTLPKNMEMENVTWQMSGSNVTVVIGRLKSANDPAVIDKSAAGQVAIIRAIGEEIRTGMAVGASKAIVP
jgi:hypothetical protein